MYSVFLLLLYFAWVALFAALLALLIYPILKRLMTALVIRRATVFFLMLPD